MEEKNNYLAHHGVKGMKWGVRRYQNTDGSLTSAGRKKYGIKSKRSPYSDGLKWNRKSKEKKDYGKAFDRTIKRGKDKSNVSPAEDIVGKANQAFSNSRKVYDSAKSLLTRSKRQSEQAKRQAAVKKMSNEELQKRIKRLELENRYLNLSDPAYNRGRNRAEDILDIIGAAGGIAAAGVGIASTIYKMKHSEDYDMEFLIQRSSDDSLMHYGVKGMKWKRRKTRFEYSPDGTYKRVAGGNNTWHKAPGIKPAMTRATNDFKVKATLMRTNRTSSDRQTSGRIRVKYIANRMKSITRSSSRRYSNRGISVFRRIRRS